MALRADVDISSLVLGYGSMRASKGCAGGQCPPARYNRIRPFPVAGELKRHRGEFRGICNRTPTCECHNSGRGKKCPPMHIRHCLLLRLLLLDAKAASAGVSNRYRWCRFGMPFNGATALLVTLVPIRFR